MKHLKSKYSGQIKEADLHLLRKKSRSDQSWLPRMPCLCQKNLSRRPVTLVPVLQHRFPCPTHLSYPIFCCSYPPLVPSLPYRVLIFFIISTVDVSYHSKLSLSHSGTAYLSLLAHLFLPQRQWHTGKR